MGIFCDVNFAGQYFATDGKIYCVGCVEKGIMGYTGDVTVEEVWAVLARDGKSVLVDVRTKAEWAFVGLCDLSAIGKSPLLICWQNFPRMEVNEAFADMVGQKNLPKSSPLYFLCRSGVRSRSAAAAMIRAGYDQCYNILGGFEGERDDNGHRGTRNGWKAAGLPWVQN